MPDTVASASSPVKAKRGRGRPKSDKIVVPDSGPKRAKGRPKKDKLVVPHPNYRNMILDAIKQMNERKGSSTFAIKKCIHGNYDFEIIHRYFAEAIKVLLEREKIKYNKESGKGSNLLKLVVKEKPAAKKPAAKKAAKKPAAKKAAKKPAAKKAAKKPAAKKAAKKPSAKKALYKTPTKKVAKKTTKK